MSQVENAAKEILQRFFRHPKMDDYQELKQIIRRHLFPLVKPEDCDKDRLYYFSCDANEWFIDNGNWAKRLCDAREIRGPVPMPE